MQFYINIDDFYTLLILYICQMHVCLNEILSMNEVLLVWYDFMSCDEITLLALVMIVY